MKDFLYIFIGGGLGSIARYGIGLIVPKYESGFPTNTFLVNIIGCFLIGLLIAFFQKTNSFHTTISLFFITGICGGFTTFSSFSVESISLIPIPLPSEKIIFHQLIEQLRVIGEIVLQGDR